MRYLFVLLLGCSVGLSAQTTPDSLVDAGIQLYRRNQAAAAETLYRQALKVDKHNGRALYELAFAAFERGDFREAIRYTTRMRKRETAALASAYQLEGSAYDELERDDKAIKRFEQGLRRFPDNHSLHYNLALVHLQHERFETAIGHLEQALSIRPTHASSHYMLGYLWTGYANKVPAALALQFFLLLEPDSPRSKQALDLLDDCLTKIATRSRPQVPATDNPVALAARQAALTFDQLPLNDRPTDLTGRLAILDTVLADALAPELGKRDDLFWTFYADFIVSVARAGHSTAFVNFITQQRGGAAYFWLEGHPADVRALFDWLATVE